jgi:LPS-assembly lipoprotein
MLIKTCLTRIGVLLLVLIMAGCGFQLRGTTQKPDFLKNIFVSGQGQYSDLIRELKNKLTSQGVQVADNAQNADLILNILDKEEDRRTLTITRSDRTDEIQLISSITFKVTTLGGSEVLTAKKVKAERIYLYDREKIIGKSYEKEMLLKEMRKDTINQLLAQLYAISEEDIANATQPEPPPAPPEKLKLEDVIN